MQKPFTSGETLPAGLPLAAANRLGEKAWSALMAFAQDSAAQTTPHFRETLPALMLIAQKQPESYRASMLDLLRPALAESYGGLDDVLWSIWSLDLRELKPDLERIATSGPGDYEGKLARETAAERTPRWAATISARQIAALWNEEDQLTRSRLLIAFGVAHADRLSEGGPERHGALGPPTRGSVARALGRAARREREARALVRGECLSEAPGADRARRLRGGPAGDPENHRGRARRRSPSRFPLTALGRSGSYAP